MCRIAGKRWLLAGNDSRRMRAYQVRRFAAQGRRYPVAPLGYLFVGIGSQIIVPVMLILADAPPPGVLESISIPAVATLG